MVSPVKNDVPSSSWVHPITFGAGNFTRIDFYRYLGHQSRRQVPPVRNIDFHRITSLELGNLGETAIAVWE